MSGDKEYSDEESWQDWIVEDVIDHDLINEVIWTEMLDGKIPMDEYERRRSMIDAFLRKMQIELEVRRSIQ